MARLVQRNARPSSLVLHVFREGHFVSGPILLGTVTSHFHSQRAGVGTVVFFFRGWRVMMTVHERRGIEAAKAGSTN